MRKITIKIGIILTFAIVLISCEKEYLNIDDQEVKAENIITEQVEGLIVLGEQLEDPYSIKNMEQAFLNMKSSNPKTPDYKINPTHMYIRFLPANNDEWDLLKSDTTILLFDFPLDYEIENSGTYYHDPSLPEDAITWQYCVLPIDYHIPDIQNELLYEVYLLKKDKSSSEMEHLFNELEYESVKLTGNLPKNYIRNTKGRWTPKGTIKVWDNLIGSTTTSSKVFDHWEYYDCDDDNGEYPTPRAISPVELCKRAVFRYVYTTTEGSYIPLVGVKVSARWFTHVETDLTDVNGYFETSSFKYEVNYAIKWERGEYDIRNGGLLQAWYNGPKKDGDWNLNIGTGGESIMYATMHRAAYKQFYGDNLDIRRPTGMGKIKLSYKDEYGTSVFLGDWIDYGVFSDIKIFGKKADGSYRTVNNIFGTTTHELGHLSHWHVIGVDNYAFTGIIIYESWATAVEWALTNDEYHTMGARFGGTAAIDYYHDVRYQKETVEGKVYTPIFVDLMDEHNQRDGGFLNGVEIVANPNLPNDLISEYSLSYIQDNILKDARGISSLHTAIKAKKIPGVTDTDIEQLFALYW